MPFATTLQFYKFNLIINSKQNILYSLKNENSLLPGGANSDIPSFEELGINIHGILKSECSTSLANGEQTATASNYGLTSSTAANSVSASEAASVLASAAANLEFHNPKLKGVVYKRLREKVNKAKVMWFAAQPERKPMSVVFEFAGVDIDHETVLEEVNQYIEHIGGNVESLEFVPRSVHVNSVNVDNLWIMTLNDMNTKFYTITNGLVIGKQKLPVKSYDEFIFSEYEKFIRNEKYKQLIKNHERAVEKSKK
jgi:hypothetical protein